MALVSWKNIFSGRDSKLVSEVLYEVKALGGRVFLVGGAVRDILLGISSEIKDIDIEVHGISLEVLNEILAKFRPVDLIGKSFGVLKWRRSGIEWAIPRRDYSGRKPKVELDPHIGIIEALKRRDLTINAMAIDLERGILKDPFNGSLDLKNRVARSPDPQFFTQDSLRFYRVMQFIGRFDLTPDKELNTVCKKMSLEDISSERIYSEFDKLFLRSDKPAKGVRWIESIGRLPEVLPALSKTVGLLQEPKFHPERDVFEHSMQALDAAALFDYKNEEEKLTLLSAALCHDLGKIEVTYVENGRLKNIGHAKVGLLFVRDFMRRITNNKKRINVVCKLVEYHMKPGSFIENSASDKAYYKLAKKLSPLANIRLLAMLAMADLQGRNYVTGDPLKEPVEKIIKFEKKAQELGVFEGPLEPLITGKDLLDFIPGGKVLGQAVDRAYQIQICEKVFDKETLKARVINEFLSETFSY